MHCLFWLNSEYVLYIFILNKVLTGQMFVYPVCKWPDCPKKGILFGYFGHLMEHIWISGVFLSSQEGHSGILGCLMEPVWINVFFLSSSHVIYL